MGEQEAERATAGEWLLGTDSAAEGGDTTVQSGPDGQTGATLVRQPEPGLTAVADRPPLDGRAAVRRPTGSRDLCRLHDREGELEEFQRVFSRPRETPSGAIIVEGGWGLGKTALLNAAAGIAHAGDVRVLRSRGGQLEQHVAFGVVQQLLDSLADRDSAELNILTDAERAMLAAAVEHTRELRADPLEVGRLAYRLWSSIASRLPLALVVDDADHADVESLAVLHYLVRRLGPVPVWVLLSGRPRVPGSPLRPLDRIAADPRARLMSLSRLRSGSVGQLVAQHFDEDPDPAAVEVFYAMSWGNPLLLFALLAIFPSDARPEPSDVSARITEKGLPRLAAAIQERVSALPLAAAHLLEAVAVLGDRADLSLAGLLGGLTPLSPSAWRRTWSVPSSSSMAVPCVSSLRSCARGLPRHLSFPPDALAQDRRSPAGRADRSRRCHRRPAHRRRADRRRGDGRPLAGHRAPRPGWRRSDAGRPLLRAGTSRAALGRAANRTPARSGDRRSCERCAGVR